MVPRSSSIFPADGGTRAIQLRTPSRIYPWSGKRSVRSVVQRECSRKLSLLHSSAFSTHTKGARYLLRCTHTWHRIEWHCGVLRPQSFRVGRMRRHSLFVRRIHQISLAWLKLQSSPPHTDDKGKRNGRGRRTHVLALAFPLRQWFMALVIVAAADFNENSPTRAAPAKGDRGVL